MEIEFIVPSVTDDIILSNMFDFSISDIIMNPIKLEELNTIVHDFPITIPEFVMPVPEGSNIEGIQIVNPALTIDIYNPVKTIDNTLILNLESIYSDGTTDTLTIEADLRGGLNSIVLNDVCNNFDSNGQMDTCISLRTGLVKDKKLYIQAGGGIVFDSDPEKEFQETINKANALMAAAKDSYKYT